MPIIGDYRGGGESSPGDKLAERCKPDYETIIKRLNQELADTESALAHLQAIHNLNISLPGDATVIQITGVLFLRQSTLKKAIAQTIEEQEKDK